MRTLTRACRIASLPLVLAAAARAQTTVRPMTSVRLTIGNEATTARIVRSDSASLIIEDATGERRTIARADVTAIEEFGTVVTSTSATEKVYYRGAFLEHPLTTGHLRLSGIASYGEYITDAGWSEHSYMKTYVQTADYQAFDQGYPYRWGAKSTRELGASVGAKASISFGTQLSGGITARLQRAGTDKQEIESGLTMSFRP